MQIKAKEPPEAFTDEPHFREDTPMSYREEPITEPPPDTEQPKKRIETSKLIV